MKYKIYLDFDGTVVEHQYPNIGKYNSGAFKVIAKLQAVGHEIILNTYRANLKDGTLQEAMRYLDNSEEINRITQIERRKIEPLSWNWERQHKTRTIFIDDICKGSPLKFSPTAPYEIVDWERLDAEFVVESIY